MNVGFIWVYLIIIHYCQQIASEFIIIIYVFLLIGILCWFLLLVYMCIYFLFFVLFFSLFANLTSFFIFNQIAFNLKRLIWLRLNIWILRFNEKWRFNLPSLNLVYKYIKNEIKIYLEYKYILHIIYWEFGFDWS